MLVRKNSDRLSVSTADLPSGTLVSDEALMKRGIAILLALVGLSLCACGGDNVTTFVEQSSTPNPASASASPPASASPSSTAGAASTQPSTSATPIAGGLRIIIDSPDGSSPISSPVDVSGTASVDNGTVVAVVLDASGNELGRGTTTASASKPDFGHYDVQVTFSAASGSKGKIKVFGVSPRDNTTPTYFYFINVSFA